MQNSSGVLVVGHPHPERMDFGADSVNSFAEAENYLHNRTPAVVVFGFTRNGEMDRFCNYLLEKSPDSLWIFNCEGLPPTQIMHWNNFGKLHDLIDGFSDSELSLKVQSALEASGEMSQNLKLVELFAGQSQQLKRLTAELESRVQKRHKTLRKSLRTLEETKGNLEVFHKAVLGIHRASSLVQIEQILNEVLSETISSVKIRFESQSLIKHQAGSNVLAIELPRTQERLRGEVLYFKAQGRKFSPKEVDFLHEITEALSLALARLHKLEEAETLKQQWQATFDSIPHPLCLTSKDHEILKLNNAFYQACGQEHPRHLIGKNAFKAFFGNGFKAPTATDSRFTFRYTRPGTRETEHFEVFGERLGREAESSDMHLVLIRSITEEVRFERRILEVSKLAELGTIGSSIAHELNNPLGGVLSFLQLILMDLPKKHPLRGDVQSMEQAALRCRDIIQNLLSFARKQDLGDFTRVKISEVVEKAVKLVELQSKSMGIEIEVSQERVQDEACLHGSSNALSQALCNLLQNAIDAISERMKSEKLFPGKIRLRVDSAKGQIQLRVSDNGTGIQPEVQTQIFNPLFTTRDPGLFSGMGLTIAFTIINEHHGSLEILSQTGAGTTAIISLPRLDQSLD